MKRPRRKLILFPITAVALMLLRVTSAADGPLPSWNDTAPKKAIIAFVELCLTVPIAFPE